MTAVTCGIIRNPIPVPSGTRRPQTAEVSAPSMVSDAPPAAASRKFFFGFCTHNNRPSMSARSPPPHRERSDSYPGLQYLSLRKQGRSTESVHESGLPKGSCCKFLDRETEPDGVSDVVSVSAHYLDVLSLSVPYLDDISLSNPHALLPLERKKASSKI